MEIVEQHWCLELSARRVQEAFTEMIGLIERAGRTCYKSEGKITEGSAPDFIRRIIDSGHESVVEHGSCSVRIVTNRGVSHELVRHRLAAFSQESTRWCRYGTDDGNIQFIKPIWFEDWSEQEQQIWLSQMRSSEYAYVDLLNLGSSPQKAREVLPNALKTELVMTANMREWRHIFRVRCSRRAHPQFRALALDMLDWFSSHIPVLFDDLRQDYLEPCTCPAARERAVRNAPN